MACARSNYLTLRVPTLFLNLPLPPAGGVRVAKILSKVSALSKERMTSSPSMEALAIRMMFLRYCFTRSGSFTKHNLLRRASMIDLDMPVNRSAFGGADRHPERVANLPRGQKGVTPWLLWFKLKLTCRDNLGESPVMAHKSSGKFRASPHPQPSDGRIKDLHQHRQVPLQTQGHRRP